MSKRGRRRNSRRKSSSSSKQSVSTYIFQKQNKSNNVSYKDDLVEKGEQDSLRKESVLPGSEDEERYNDSPPKEKRFKQDYHVNLYPNQKSIYAKTTEDKENGVKIVTSVSVSDLEDCSPKITFQQSHEPLSENVTQLSTPVTNIMNINCSGSHVKLEIQEIRQLNNSGIKTIIVLMNEKGDSSETFLKSKCEKTWMPSNDFEFEQPTHKVPSDNGDQTTNYTYMFGSMNEQTEAQSNSKSPSPTNYCQCCSDHKQQKTMDCTLTNHPSSPPVLLNIKPQVKRKHVHKRLSSEQSWDIPPPQEFADVKRNSLDDLTLDLASCRIGTCSTAEKQEEKERTPSFDQLSVSDNYEPMFMRPSLSTNRSSFTKDFVNCQKRKSWIRNNSIATVEHRACMVPKKRRQTFPGISDGLSLMQEDFLMPYSESLSSLFMCSFHLQTEKQCNEKSPACGIEHCNPSKAKGISIPVPDSHDGKQSYLSPFYMTRSNDNQDDEFAVSEQCQRTNIVCHRDLSQQNEDFSQRDSKDMESLDTDDCEYKVYHSEVADSGFDQTGDAEYCSPEPLTEELSHRAFAIQVIPPSCSGSEEQIPQSHPEILFQNNTSQMDSVPVSPKHRKSSVRTITVGVLEERFMQMDSRSSCSCMEKHIGTASDDPDISPSQDVDVHPSYSSEILEKNEPREYGEETENTSSSLPLNIEERNHLQLDTGGRARGDSVKSLVTTLCSAKGSTDAEINAIKLSKPDKAEKQIVPRSSLETKEHLKPALHKEPDSSGSDHWARRRKLFKETKQWSSAGGSSMTSDITEESVSEDTCSLDMTVQDMEDRGFYTESFHSSAWIFQGDNAASEAVTPTLNARTRVVSIRERTVKISKGTGEYPWGFRIQFSKPIVVTEVDTNGAAEEAGLLVGDYVLAVNGTDVTSIPHSEAANLARQGPDILTLTIGSDVARGPNTPRPACRGYLHKRTQSGLIKGWRKRWFVLKHDCCLYYYRHRRDEGKRRPLSAVKLEGAEVGKDSSLGKPFVFKCHPQSGNRMYYLCATSNQEMKRWLEAMEKAIHPITQNHVWVDVTRHNANLPPLAVKNPECLGLLHKIDKNKDMWVQHYCILKDGCLYLYSGIRATRAHGGMYLQGYMVREQPYGSKKSTIELKPASDEFKTFYLCAENPNENKRWIVAIKASIKKWVPLHQALQDYMNRVPEETRM